MIQLGVISLCIQEETHSVVVYQAVSESDPIPPVQPELFEKYFAVVCSGDITERAEAMVYQVGSPKAAGGVSLRKNQNGQLDYAD